MRTLHIAVYVGVVLGVCATELLRAAEAPYIKSGPRVVTVAEGYSVELIAGPPLVERPIAVARDEQGRLYVTDSGGMSEKAEQQLQSRPHRIRRLEDVDGDGIYDRSTLFADRMMFPEGCLWRDGSLYVAAPPEIWKLTDDDDDGICDRREVWFDGQTLTGCGNDLHGPYSGPDGRMYWCKGAFAEQRHVLENGRELVTRSSHIFRADLSGGQLEPVLTGGMDNPVNVAFLANGDRFLSCTFFQHPADGKRDGLLHAVYGGVYGKRHASIQDHPRTGDVMPVLVHMGAAAPCGLIAGSRTLFGGGHSRALFGCYFNLHQVVRHKLIQEGATWTTEETVLMSSDHPDFHPTDVFEDADGSLIVVDTGGWYKICCPTSLMAKPDVLGGIYRIRRNDADSPSNPLGEEISWPDSARTIEAPQLVSLLRDERLFVRRRATETLRMMGIAAVQPLAELLESSADHGVRCDAVWCLAGIDHDAARRVIRSAVSDDDQFVRAAAISVCGLWRDGRSREQVEEQLRDEDPMIRRVAAEALGRIGDARSVQPLMHAAEELGRWTPDAAGAPSHSALRVLHHSLVYALMEIEKPDPLRTYLTSNTASVRQAALVAFDQGLRSTLTTKEFLPLLEDPDPAVRATAAWVAGGHPEWADEIVAHLRRQVRESESDEAVRHAGELALRLIASQAVQEFVSELIEDTESAALRDMGLEILGKSSLPKLPQPWSQSLARQIAAGDPSVSRQCVESLLRMSPDNKFGAELRRSLKALATNEEIPANVRVQAASIVSPLPEVTQPLLDTLLIMIVDGANPEQQSRAARVLGAATLTADQRRALLEAVPQVGPLQLPELLPALAAEPSIEFGTALVDALSRSSSLSVLRQDQVTELFREFPEPVRAQAQQLFAGHYVSAAEQAEHIRVMMTTLPPGNINRGHAVFTGTTAGCLKCHKLGYHGGSLGPDLTNIGRTRRPAEILEAVLFPSATIVRGYEPVTLELTDGRIQGGIVTDESTSWVRLGIDGERAITVQRGDIEAIHPSRVSPMPRGIGKLLTDQEIADLLAFLARPGQ